MLSLKARFNQARLSLVIRPHGGILVKAGDAVDPTRPEMQFVRMRTPELDTVYIPGSSLKGVIRSCAERLLRTLNVNLACDPLGKKSCGRKKKKDYRNSCRICRTFGSTSLGSRLEFSDAFPWPATATPAERVQKAAELDRHLNIRPGIAIDRKTGKPRGGAVFEMEVLAGGELFFTVTARNYQLWQLGLLWLVFEELNRGDQKLGYAKSRGLGRVDVEVTELVVDQFGPLASTDASPVLRGIGDITGADDEVRKFREHYDLLSDDSCPVEATAEKTLFGQRLVFTADQAATTIKSLVTSPAMKALIATPARTEPEEAEPAEEEQDAS